MDKDEAGSFFQPQCICNYRARPWQADWHGTSPTVSNKVSWLLPSVSYKPANKCLVQQLTPRVSIITINNKCTTDCAAETVKTLRRFRPISGLYSSVVTFDLSAVHVLRKRHLVETILPERSKTAWPIQFIC